MHRPETSQLPPFDERMWVVGESFAPAATLHPYLWTAAQLLHALDNRSWTGSRVRLAAGLGIDPATWTHLWAQIRARELTSVFAPDRSPATAVAPHLVMRRRPQDVVIGAARRVSDHEAEAELIVPDGHHFLRLDPVNWQHVPGILLVEAAIQLMTWGAVQLPVTAGPGRLPVQQACRADYQRFVFPIATRLRLDLRLTDPAGPDRIPFTGIVEVCQAGRSAARITFDARVFDQQSILAIEHSKAAATITGTPPPPPIPTLAPMVPTLPEDRAPETGLVALGHTAG